MDTIIKEAEEKLKKYKQDSVFKLMNKLEGEKKIALAESILSTDLESVQNVFKTINDKKESASVEISPMNATVKEKVSDGERESYYEIGKKVIENNEYAVVTVAGGQGTRLGHNGPKGTYKINTIKGEKSLFEILCETMKDAKKKFGVTIPWYIMTSDENNDQTVAFFEANNYFGYDKDKINFFKQSKMPVVDTEGKLLVDENYKIKEASDGHGGKSFHETFRDEPDLNRMMQTFLNRTPEETIVDQWQSQIFARVLLKATVIFVSSCDDQLVKDLHMIPAHSMEEAMDIAKSIVNKDNYSVTVIPDGVAVIVRE